MVSKPFCWSKNEINQSNRIKHLEQKTQAKKKQKLTKKKTFGTQKNTIFC